MQRGYQTKANDERVGAIAGRSKAFTLNRFSGFQKLIVTDLVPPKHSKPF